MGHQYYAVAAAVAAINTVGVVIYAISSFGNAIFFHVLYNLCSKAFPDVCTGGLPLVVAYITFGSIVLFPMQILILYKYINWELAFYLTVSQQLSQYLGMLLLFTFDSIWIERILGYFFYIVAIEMLYSNIKKRYITTTTTEVTSERYQVDSCRKIALIVASGFVSGLFSGLFATGGPPLIIFVTISQLNSLECRATFAICFAIQNVGRIVVYLFYQSKIDVYSFDFIFIVIMMTISAIMSLLIGNYIAKFVNQDKFIQVLCGILMISSVLLITDGYNSSNTIIIMVILIVLFSSVGYFAYYHYRMFTPVPLPVLYSAVSDKGEVNNNYYDDCDIQATTLNNNNNNSNNNEEIK